MLGDEMPPDDANNFLQSAYACGRRIVVTDFGKQMMLKVQNSTANTIAQAAPPVTVHAKNGDMKAKPPVNMIVSNAATTKILTAKPNVLKRISSEQLNKLVGDGKLKSVGNSSATIANGSIRFPKYRITPMPKTLNVSGITASNESRFLIAPNTINSFVYFSHIITAIGKYIEYCAGEGD